MYIRRTIVTKSRLILRQSFPENHINSSLVSLVSTHVKGIVFIVVLQSLRIHSFLMTLRKQRLHTTCNDLVMAFQTLYVSNVPHVESVRARRKENFSNVALLSFQHKPRIKSAVSVFLECSTKYTHTHT